MANPVLESLEFSEFVLRVTLQKVSFKFPLPLFDTYLLQRVKIDAVIFEKITLLWPLMKCANKVIDSLISLHCLHFDLNFLPLPWFLSLHKGHNVSFNNFSLILE